MNNEIKEILDRLFVYKNENDEMKYQPEDILTIGDVWLLLDYITNLQEENKQLKKKINIEWLSDEGKYQYAIDCIVLEMDKLEEENERLNNIINELEKYFDEELENLGYREEKLYTQGIHDTIINHKYLLQELKGDSSNE